MGILIRSEFRKEVLDRLSPYEPDEHEKYIKFTCPACGGRKDAAVYPEKAGWYTWAKCNHRNSCGWAGQLYRFLRISLKQAKARTFKEFRELFRAHGLSPEMLLDSNIVTKDFEVVICPGKNLKLRQKEGDDKYRWHLPYQYNAEDSGEFLESYHTRHSTLYVLGGIWDWFKGVEDGLSCTTSVCGEGYVPKNPATWDIFLSYIRIIICYDLDKAGAEGAKKLAKKLKDRFPEKEIQILKLPLEPPGKDYCDYRALHSVEDFMSLEGAIVSNNKTSQESNLEKWKAEVESLQSAEGPEEEIKRIPVHDKSAYIVAKNGVFIWYVEKKWGYPAELTRRLCHDSVTVTERYGDLASDSVFVKLQWGRKKKLVPQSWLSSTDFKKLADLGLRINKSNGNDMSGYFLAALGEVEKEHFYSSKNGWIDKDRFVLGEVLHSADQKETVPRNDSQYLIQTGREEGAWLEKVRCLARDEYQNQLVLGAATVAPLLKHISVNPFVFHIWGQSSIGKSYGIYAAASFWGEPGNLVQQWNGTRVGHESYFEEMNSLPCFLDEAHLAREEVLSETCYTFGNSKGRSRGTISNGAVVSAKQKFWHTVLLSTGERKITDASTQGGLSARVVEVKKKLLRKLKEEEITDLDITLRNHYGWGGPKIIEYVFQNRKDLKKQLQENLADLSEVIKTETTIQNRLLRSWAAILLGCQVNFQLFKIPYDSNEIFAQIQESLDDMENKNPVEGLYEKIIGLYMENYKRFHRIDEGGRLIEADSPEGWGLREGDNLYFFNNILKRELEKLGSSMSQVSLLQEQGYLLTNEKKGYSTKIPFFLKGSRPRATWLVLPKDEKTEWELEKEIKDLKAKLKKLKNELELKRPNSGKKG